MLRPLRKHSLYEDVAKQLLALIREQYYRPGQQLPGERELADLLNVNRHTLREALRVLELMRVVEKRTGEGVFVRDLERESSVEVLVFRFLTEDGLDEASLRSSYEAVVGVESTMARLAAQRAGKAEIEELRGLLSQMEIPSISVGVFTDLDRELHLLVGKVGKSPVLLQMAQTIWIIIERYARVLFQDEPSRAEAIRQHRLMIESIVEGDGDRAYREMEQHLQWAWNVLFGEKQGEQPPR